ncbi:hypothetical protein DdX_19229 [Ditylenchus destructor]|uniref:F-box domain-containing protein n=1 Tax=Ditylenchus destructor TaxID=166010 RepID=A0AAD4QUB8_9BILA|nr:hypothetical protein DdX_19229 [Ditylenchus destructor]
MSIFMSAEVLREILCYFNRIQLSRLELVNRNLRESITISFNKFPYHLLDSVNWTPSSNTWDIYLKPAGLDSEPQYKLKCAELNLTPLAARKFYRCLRVTIDCACDSNYNCGGELSEQFIETLRIIQHLWTSTALHVSWSSTNVGRYNHEKSNCFCDSLAAQMLPTFLSCSQLELRNPPMAILDLNILYRSSKVKELYLHDTGDKLENAAFITQLANCLNYPNEMWKQMNSTGALERGQNASIVLHCRSISLSTPLVDENLAGTLIDQLTEKLMSSTAKCSFALHWACKSTQFATNLREFSPPISAIKESLRCSVNSRRFTIRRLPVEICNRIVERDWSWCS